MPGDRKPLQVQPIVKQKESLESFSTGSLDSSGGEGWHGTIEEGREDVEKKQGLISFIYSLWEGVKSLSEGGG